MTVGDLVLFEVTADTRERVIEILDQLSSDWDESLRKVYKVRNSTFYRGRALYDVGWQGLKLDLRS